MKLDAVVNALDLLFNFAMAIGGLYFVWHGSRHHDPYQMAFGAVFMISSDLARIARKLEVK